MLEILGYQSPFIQGYTQLVQPLTELTQKGIPFQWEEKYTEALDQLIHMVMTAAILKCPDPEKQYFLEVDTSIFILGAVLFQQGEDD